MQDVVNNLVSKYKILITEYEQMKKQKVVIDANIDDMKQALNFPWNFDDNDIKELSSMLPSKYRVKLQNIRSYLSVLNKFPNQPQIVEAKLNYEEIKHKLIEVIDEENNDFYSLFEQLEEKVQFFETIIDDLTKYNDNTYLSSISLYKLIYFLTDSDITEELINFYEMVLQNNIMLYDDIKVDETADSELDIELKKFIFRLNRINKSLTSATFETDTIIYNFFNQMLEANHEKKSVTYQYSIINSILSSDIENKPVLERLKFLIHLYKVGIDLFPEQLAFIGELKQVYYDRIKSSQKCQTTIFENKKLIGKLESEELYTDLDLLNEVFSLNNISFLDRLKVISCIIHKNVIYISKEKDKIKTKKSNS